MNDKLAVKAKEALKESEFWTDKTRETERSIQGLICPVCGDRSAWAYPEPFAIICNKSNKCGSKTNTRELLNITFDIEEEYKPTANDKHRPAREYLKSRGIKNEVLKNLDFRYWKDVRNLPTGAVMFLVGKDKNKKDIFNGRLFSPPANEGKTHNQGSTAGVFWSHPGRQLNLDQPVLITEGIIDALSLIQMGVQAIAVLSSGQDPKKLDALNKYQLICAFDNDQAGINATSKYLKAFRGASAMMPPKGKDWNDLLKHNTKEPGTYFKEKETLFRQNAELAMANDAHQYGELYQEFFNRAPGLFVFNGRTWYGQMKTRGETPTLAIERVGLFTIEVISFVNIGSEIHKEFLYHLCVNPFNGRPVNCVATGKTLSTAKDFNSFLLSSAKVNFEGNANAIRALATQITTTKAPEVRQVPVVGYDPQTKWYVYDSFAIDKSGKHHLADKRGLYNLGANSMIKAAAQATEKAIKPTSISTKQIKHIHDLFHKAWGDNGIIAFSWVIASWFVNQIKGKENFFPFLSLHGDPAAGKSALANKLQAIQGRDLEGLPLSQLNTKKGLARTMAGFSGMFTALLEDNQRNERSFDYSILLTAYNTGSLQIQAKFTNTLETQENPFLGALLFVQNNEPFNQKAEKQRVISLHFKTNTLTNNTLKAFKELNEMPKEELAAILVEVLKKRSEIEATWYDEYRTAAADLEQVQEDRIRNNHALILAFHRIFCKLFSISSTDIHGTLEQVAKDKELSSAELETNAASIFFHKVFSLKSEQLDKYWHEIDMHESKGRARANRLYFSTVELTRLLTSNNLTPPREEDLERALQEHPAFIRRSVNHYFPDPPKPNTAGPTKIQRKSWKFDLAKFREVESPPEHMSAP